MGRLLRLQLEQLSEPFGLRAAHWELGLLAVVHPELIGALEPWQDFLDAIDVHHM